MLGIENVCEFKLSWVSWRVGRPSMAFTWLLIDDGRMGTCHKAYSILRRRKTFCLHEVKLSTMSSFPQEYSMNENLDYELSIKGLCVKAALYRI
jgi:hypothetical protein